MIHKVIVTGPVGSGKTTAVNSLVGENVLSTDAKASDVATSKRKKQTTVAMDYGVVNLGNGDVVHLYGTPGQDRFDFMWDILCQGAHGLVLLLDNARNYPKRDLKHYTQLFAEIIKTTRLIIGITRTDISERFSIQDYKLWLQELNLKAEVIPVDARKKSDIQHLVKQLIQPEESKTTSYSEPVAETSSRPANYDVGEKTLRSILELNGVNGISTSNALGEVQFSTIHNEDLNEFIAFLSGVAPMIEEQSELGEISKIMLRSPNDDNLTVFTEQGTSIGIISDRKLSVTTLSQQVEDLLQWND